ncbi:hypothetical protein [Hymenobacter sp. HDW8]|uniref:hypothetical protein n=1 Tax=Hymenobacter sp. HDW8 TaxID=2714932 RepID=UPI00140CAA43|nr:hypothetical protein [Hymenobacter sp. HDW8]QIL75208.1 hypothetical protein G7064_04605 [Hymenobacter sp. HDW8]
MHNNYYFLRQLAPALTAQLSGYQVAACFSQEKDELVIGLTNGSAEFWLKAQLTASFPVLALPTSFHRTRTNSVDLLPDLLGRTVTEADVFPHDRVLTLRFADGASLLFKLYGPRPNAIFRSAPDAPAQLFHQRYTTDADLAPLSPAADSARPSADPLKSYPALGDLPPATYERMATIQHQNPTRSAESRRLWRFWKTRSSSILFIWKAAPA